MSFSFIISFTGDASDLVARAQAAVQESDAFFCGDKVSGRFAGQGVEGNYVVTGQDVLVTIEKKPWLLTKSFVQDRITKFFTE